MSYKISMEQSQMDASGNRLLGPISLADNAYNKSPEEKKILQLQVSWTMNPANPREIQWHLVCLEGKEINGTASIHSRIGLVNNHGQLINWGPITNASTNDPPRPTHYCEVEKLDTEQRTKLEDISRKQNLLRGDPEWNGKNWIVELMETAQSAGILTQEACEEAILVASNIVKTSVGMVVAPGVL